MTVKGFPSNKKNVNIPGKNNEFATVIPTDPYRNALDIPRFAFRVDSDTVPRVATADTGIVKTDLGQQFWIGDTATPARVGDFVRFQTGLAQFIEFPILKVETDRFAISCVPDELPAQGDQFYIMRFTTQRVSDTGSQIVVAQQGPTQFVYDGNDIEVEEDTGIPANSRPLPVKNLDGNGVEVDFATETTLAAIDTKTPALVGGAVPVTGPLTDTQLRATPVPISAASLPLPTGAATEATLGLVEIHTEAAAIILNEAATGVQPFSVSATALPLPAGAATEVTLAAMSAKLPATLGQKAMAASMAVTIASDQSAVPVIATSVVNTGSVTNISNLVATAQTLTAPANAIGFKIQAPSTNTENISFTIGATATISTGILMEPGRSEDFDTGSNISVIATSAAAQRVTVLWKVKP